MSKFKEPRTLQVTTATGTSIIIEQLYGRNIQMYADTIQAADCLYADHIGIQNYIPEPNKSSLVGRFKQLADEGTITQVIWEK